MSKEKILISEKDYGCATVNAFRDYLIEEQNADNTISNYCKVAKDFVEHLNIKDAKQISKLKKLSVLKYVSIYSENNLKASTINNHINALNGFFKFCKRNDLRVKTIHCRRMTYLKDEELLTDDEIHKILNYAMKLKDKRYYYAILIMLQTGVRVSELEFVTVEALRHKEIRVFNKGSGRPVPMSDDLIEVLNEYCESVNIKTGIIIRTRNGKCLDRSAISKMLKEIARALNIDERKVHSHNFRHEFALRYIQNNGENALSNLADILGHRSIETTRIYTMKTFTSLRKTMTRKVLKIKITT